MRRFDLPLLVLGGVVVVLLALRIGGVAPGEAAATLAKGSFGSIRAFSGTLRETAPLLLLGGAVFLALRAGLFNIGAEGQYVVGAAAATATGLKISGPLGIALGTLAGVLAGAAWAWPAGAIRAYRNGHEVITTIMLNSVALLGTDWLVGASGPLKGPAGATSTALLPEGSRLPALSAGGATFGLALPLGVALAFGLAWWLARTVAGYELRAVGANPTAARFAGVDDRRAMVRAMVASGAIAGFAGALQAFNVEYRFYQGFSPGYGFDALGVALLAGEAAVGLIPAALLFGALAKGGTALAISGVPKGITGIVLAVVILVAGALRYRRRDVVA